MYENVCVFSNEKVMCGWPIANLSLSVANLRLFLTSLSLSVSLSHTHTHTHSTIYVHVNIHAHIRTQTLFETMVFALIYSRPCFLPRPRVRRRSRLLFFFASQRVKGFGFDLSCLRQMPFPWRLQVSECQVLWNLFHRRPNHVCWMLFFYLFVLFCFHDQAVSAGSARHTSRSWLGHFSGIGAQCDCCQVQNHWSTLQEWFYQLRQLPGKLQGWMPMQVLTWSDYLLWAFVSDSRSLLFSSHFFSERLLLPVVWTQYNVHACLFLTSFLFRICLSYTFFLHLFIFLPLFSFLTVVLSQYNAVCIRNLRLGKKIKHFAFRTHHCRMCHFALYLFVWKYLHFYYTTTSWTLQV